MTRHLLSPVQRRFFFFFVVVLLFHLQGCDSGGGAGPIAAPEGTYSIGFFVDSPVEGLEYSSITWSGITDAQGGFYYRGDEDLTFHLGDVVIGRIPAMRIITPVDLGGVAANTASTVVINIAQFLQSLDIDLNPANGITIPQEVRDALQGISVDFTQDDLNNDAGVQEMFDRLNDMGIYPEEEIGLIPAEEAQLHLEETIINIEEERAAAEEALANMKLQANIGDPCSYSSVIMIQGQSLNLKGYVYGGKAPYTYSWQINDEKPFSSSQSPGLCTFRTQGSYTITFTAQDSAGDVKTDIRQVHVYGPETQEGPFLRDSFPIVAIVNPPDNSVYKVGDTVTFQTLLYNGNVPLYYGWGVGAAPGNTYDPRSETIVYNSPRWFIISQDIAINSRGDYPLSISVQDTGIDGKGPDRHATSVRITVK